VKQLAVKSGFEVVLAETDAHVGKTPIDNEMVSSAALIRALSN